MNTKPLTALCLSILTMCAGMSSASAEETLDPIIESRSTSYVTHDLAATTRFYTEYLGLKEAFRAEVTAAKSRATYGVFGDEKITVVGFAPPELIENRNDFAGLAFIAIEGKSKLLVDRGPDYIATVGQLVMAHRVKNLDEIERRMKAAGVPVVSPLGPSATGRSRTMTVVDPNGIRIETYEYVEKK